MRCVTCEGNRSENVEADEKVGNIGFLINEFK